MLYLVQFDKRVTDKDGNTRFEHGQYRIVDAEDCSQAVVKLRNSIEIWDDARADNIVAFSVIK